MVYKIKIAPHFDKTETDPDKLVFDHKRQFPVRILNNSFISIADLDVII
jgi:hypothetical protein